MITSTHALCSSFMGNSNTVAAVTACLPTMPDLLDYIDGSLTPEGPESIE